MIKIFKRKPKAEEAPPAGCGEPSPQPSPPGLTGRAGRGRGSAPPAGVEPDGAKISEVRRRLNQLDHDSLVAFIQAGFPAVIDHISPAMGKADKVDELLNYCLKGVQWADLEAALEAYRPPPPLRRLAGANMDIDLATPPGTIAWRQDPCPWNQAEGTVERRCAVKGVSICRYFRGVEPIDTLLCAYPLPQDPVSQE